MIKKIIITLLLLISLLPGSAPLRCQDSGTITARQRDTILLMTARENPHYDICLVLDVSDSMKPIIEKLKEHALQVADFAAKDDTLIFIKFDDSPRKPLIQQIRDGRDLEMFKGWIRKTVTTQGFGTDIQAAYASALNVLQQLNEARKKQGEPVRIQYVVFVSDGDDIPPANSPFRNPASAEAKTLQEMIDKAGKEQLINLIPVGMSFKGYVPSYVRFDPGQEPPSARMEDPEIRRFVDQLKSVLNRQPMMAMGPDTGKVPRKDYQFYIDWLSGRLELKKLSVTQGSEKHSLIYRYQVKSNFQALKAENLSVSASYVHKGGRLEGQVVETVISSRSLEPGGKAFVDVTVKFPLNWKLKKEKSDGILKLTLTGDMKAGRGPSPAAGAAPSPSPADTPLPSPAGAGASPVPDEFYFPFNTCERADPVTIDIPVARALYWYAALGILALIFFPASFLYQIVVPITVTLKMEDKARSFALAHKNRITIGGKSDFTIPGCDGDVAEIQRRFRQFVLVAKAENAIPGSFNPRDGKIPLKLGDGFSLNAGGSYKEFEFLPGNREFADGEGDYSPDAQEVDSEEDLGEFKF